MTRLLFVLLVGCGPRLEEPCADQVFLMGFYQDAVCRSDQRVKIERLDGTYALVTCCCHEDSE